MVRALSQALPFVSALRWAREEQARLLEMIADDDAARHGDRLSVAGALIRLAGGAVPAAAPAVAAAQMEYCPITSTISIA